MSQRLGHTDKPWLIQHINENLTIRWDALTEPDQLPGPRWIFMPSSSDLYLPQIPKAFVECVIEQLKFYNEHCFQVLTKHGPTHEARSPKWPQNVILTVSIATEKRLNRLDWLREQDAATKAVSFEPLVECIPDANLSGIDWVIIGGESGGGDNRREMKAAWARNLVRAARRQDVPVFFKQHSGPYAEGDVELDMLDGRGRRRIEEFPELPSGVVDAPVEFSPRSIKQ